MDLAVWTIGRFVSCIVPMARKEISRWRNRALGIPCPELRKQALASIDTKSFHVLGGSIYALYPRGRALTRRADVLRAITAIQTISDYLDNLCDRAGESDEHAFRQLHKSMLDALDPGHPSEALFTNQQDPSLPSPGSPNLATADLCQLAHSRNPESYYLGYPYCEDNGYLSELVDVCRTSLASLPGYESVKSPAINLARLYCDLQSLKHLDQSVRRERLRDWATAKLEQMQDTQCLASLDTLEWWEFAAATGSTLGLFMLFAVAARGAVDRNVVNNILNAYFPCICGLHILLDYLIDLEEDRIHKDFNFVSCYSSERYRHDRLAAFVKEAIARAQALPRPGLHLVVVRGLLALYLSDPKVKAGGLSDEASRLCKIAGGLTPLMRQTCLGLRRIELF